MKIIAQQFMSWLMSLTMWMRYLVIALMLHAAILFGLATIKIAVAMPTIIATFTGEAPPPQPTRVVDDIDPFAALRDFDYSGPTLGGGGGTPGKGPGGIPTAAGTTPSEYVATVLTRDAAAADKTVGEVIGVDVGNIAGAIARLQGGPGALAAPTMGLGEGRFGTSGVRGPGGGGFGQRIGPMRAKRIQAGGSSGEAERSVLAALRWLKNHQRPDGSWESKYPVAITGLAALAFLGHGHTPDDPEFGQTLMKAFDYLVSKVPQNNMYEHAILTYALAEGYGMTQSPQLKEPLQRCIDALIKSQQVKKDNPLHAGGWRYQHSAKDADVSVTGWCVQALEAAKLAGMEIPQSVFDAAARYLWNMYSNGSFGYTEPSPGLRVGTTAIGILCQAFLGQGGDPRIKTALDKLRNEKFDWEKDKGWTIYTWYYLTQAFFQGGGSYWESWNNSFRDALIRRQASDGHWPYPPESRENYGLAYSTALCCLMLEVYYRYLPTYQSIEQRQLEKRPATPGPTAPKLQTKATP
ncbi:MAG: terpene cyclase/mutase family protein [Verrucomicrobiae bacterium]|nr:terpene cyclase/mutase family protein [Verrucomicrobiae bacterium]